MTTALEALKTLNTMADGYVATLAPGDQETEWNKRHEACQIIRAALTPKETAGEPVAWLMKWPDGGVCCVTLSQEDAQNGSEHQLTAIPLYALASSLSEQEGKPHITDAMSGCTADRP